MSYKRWQNTWSSLLYHSKCLSCSSTSSSWSFWSRHGLPDSHIHAKAQVWQTSQKDCQKLDPRSRFISSGMFWLYWLGHVQRVCANQDEYADTVTSYVSFCTDSCIPWKTVTIYANDKPWFSKDVKHKLIAKNDAFKNSDKNQYKVAKYETEKAIRRAKAQYRNKLEKTVLNIQQPCCVAGPPAYHPV